MRVIAADVEQAPQVARAPIFETGAFQPVSTKKILNRFISGVGGRRLPRPQVQIRPRRALGFFGRARVLLYRAWQWGTV